MRVLLVEDEPWVREDVADLLERSGVTVAAACATLAETRRRLEIGLAFDVGLIDLGLPDGSGVELIAGLRAARPNASLVAFTVHDDPERVFAALRAGARGYLLKSTPVERLVPSLEEAAQGGAPLSPAIARMIIDSVVTEPEPVEEASAITPRETEVLTLLAKGVSYAQVGSALGIALGTVQAHVRNIYSKLEIGSKAEAAVVAAKLGLV